MNTYNDNLHNSVVASLNEQEIALQSISAKYKAAQDTLSYRQGNRVNTYEDLQLASKVQNFYEEAKEKTAEDNNSSINLMGAVDQSKAYIDKTITNTSTAAANVQIATNAITKLASDVGSIFSMVNAANFESEIYYLSLRCKERMGETAFNAEAVSQTSMEATSSVSNVPISDLKKRADKINSSVLQLQEVVNAEYTKANEKVKTDSSKLEMAVNSEKKAEGELFVVQREYNSTALAYNLTNLELNLNLNVITPEVNVAKQVATLTVAFQDYESPFPDPSDPIPKDPSEYQAESRYFPVDEYYIFIVKYKNKSTFSISNAEEILNQYPISPAGSTTDQQHDVRYSTKVPDRSNYPSEETIPSVVDNLTLLLDKDFKNSEGVSQPFNPAQNNPDGSQLDSDGDPIDLGAQYVVFVMAAFNAKYKKAINNFNDYLSGASYNFKLQVDIPEAEGWNVGNKETSEGDAGSTTGQNEDNTAVGAPYVGFMASNEVVVEELEELGVTMSEVEDKPVHYRCIFLPVLKENVGDPLLLHSMATNNTVEDMSIVKKEQETQQKVTDSSTLQDSVSRVANLGTPYIGKDQTRIKEFEDENSELEKLIQTKNQQIDGTKKKLDPLQKSLSRTEGLIKRYKENGDKEKEKIQVGKKEDLEKQMAPLNNKINTLNAEITDFKNVVKENTEGIAKLKKDIENRKSEKSKLEDPDDLGFLFNKEIAAKIPASNYTLAQLLLEQDKEEESPEISEDGSEV
ncbi:MAG: hypothetical protein AAGC88_13525, partial [Bacteroidota bacterium]